MSRAAPEQAVDKPWHCLTGDEALRRLDAPANGLSTAQAAERRAIIGPNTIAETKPVSAWAIFFAQFKSILIWMLIGASVVSGVLGDATDSLVILAIVFLNAVVGFYQEYSAEKSIEALKQITAPRAKVWRDGAVTTIASAEVVPADLLELEAGDLVPADARLLSAASPACMEAALTGESEPVAKSIEALDEPQLTIGDRTNMVFMGTNVVAGSGRAVVVATGMQTEMGRIASLISEAGEPGTPLQQKLERFGHVLLWATLAIVTLLFGLGLLRKDPILDLFLTSVSLAVAALPESLPAVATAALSLGVLRMARRRALVRRLASAETLGSTNVICTDKTGTLTVGQMTVRAMLVAGRTYDVSGEGYGPQGEVRLNGEFIEPSRDSALRRMAEILVGCNNAHIERDKGSWNVIGDPTEGALLSAGQKAGGDRNALDRDSPRLHELPFDSDRKLHSIVRRLPDGRQRVLTNGAPETLLAKCSHIWRDDGVHPLTDGDRKELTRQNTHLASNALRVLGSAFRDFDALPLDRLAQETIERDLVFVGLLGLYDPPRPEAKEAVAKCRAAGIRAVMITGDHPHTAMAIGKELGLTEDGQSVMAGVDLDKLTDDELLRRVSGVAVYARVTAADKLRIIRAWQANGAVVAMTGDGVNDAPAIKGADIGVAMGRSGTEVTKQASDMIVTDDNFATIVDAVEEGRGIYENIRKTLLYLLGCNASELLLITICIVSGLPTPLLPIHLLWINLITDGPPALCLAADRVDPRIMNQRPRERGEQLTDERFFWAMLLTAALISSVAFLAFLRGLQSGDLQLARTNAFSTMVFAQLLISLGARSQTTPIWRVGFFSNLNLLVIVIASTALQMSSHINTMLSHFLETSELPYEDSFVLLAAASLPLLMLELIKLAPPAVTKEARAAPPTTRWIGWMTTGVVAATIAGGWLYWPPPAAQFVTRVLERGSVVRAVSATGIVRPRPTTTVFAPLTGIVQFRDCEVGVKVAKGQLCAAIEQRLHRLAVERQRAKLAAARAQMDKDEAGLARAKLALERARVSAKRSGIGKATRAHERALTRTRRSEDLIAQHEATLRAAEIELGGMEVRAPMDGTVISRGAETGEPVEAGKSTLFAITDWAVAQIEVAPARSDVDEVEIGDWASINVDAAQGRLFDGQATEVRKAQNIVVLSAPDAERLLETGRTVTARIVIDQRLKVLRAPNEALRYSRNRNASQFGVRDERSDSTSLWVLRKGESTPVPVRLGLDDGAHTEIVEGDFEPGDEMIIGESD